MCSPVSADHPNREVHRVIQRVALKLERRSSDWDGPSKNGGCESTRAVSEHQRDRCRTSEWSMAHSSAPCLPLLPHT